MKKVAPEVRYVDPRSLKNHIKHIELYGGEINADLEKSVERSGRIMVPLLVAADGVTVISGRSRRQVAVKLGIKQVAIIVDETLSSEEDMVIALIEANAQREKTNEQKAREYEALQLAYSSKNAKIASATPSAETTCDPGKHSASTAKKESPAKASAASQVGMSRKTADKAVEVVKTIDVLESSGDHEHAQELRETLNKSVSAAHAVVHPKEKRKAPSSDTRKSLMEAEKAAKLVGKHLFKAQRSNGGPCSYSELAIKALETMNEVINDWMNDT